MRGFLKQYLTEKQNGYLQSGHLQEVVAMGELTVCKTVGIFNIMVKEINKVTHQRILNSTCYH